MHTLLHSSCRRLGPRPAPAQRSAASTSTSAIAIGQTKHSTATAAPAVRNVMTAILETIPIVASVAASLGGDKRLPQRRHRCEQRVGFLYSRGGLNSRETKVPVYEYTCSACGEVFEQLIRSSGDERKVSCPKCGEKRVERKLSVIAAPRATAAKPPPGPCGSCSGDAGSCPFK